MSRPLDLSGLITKLEETQTWPCEFVFKCIIPYSQVPEARRRFEHYALSERESSNGKYVSLTITITAESSRDIAIIYETAGTLPGVILL